MTGKAHRNRPKQVKFRLNEAEFDKLQTRIAESGLSNQEYIRRAVLGATIQDNTEIKELLPKLKKISTELSRQGNNLNQIANVLNARGYIDYKKQLPQALENARKAIEEVRELWRLLRQYLQKHR